MSRTAKMRRAGEAVHANFTAKQERIKRRHAELAAMPDALRNEIQRREIERVRKAMAKMTARERQARGVHPARKPVRCRCRDCGRIQKARRSELSKVAGARCTGCGGILDVIRAAKAGRT